MKILIVAVNFNSYDKLKDYLSSIENAVLMDKDSEVTIYIADNSTKKEDFYFQSTVISLSIESLDNLGYFGGASYIINKITDILAYDYVIISNVDVTLQSDFFVELKKIRIPTNTGWIVPSIFSKLIKEDKNPSVLKRYSRLKLKLLKFTYNRYVLPIYEKIYYRKKRERQRDYPQMEIYAGHGSFFILTKKFFKYYKEIHYPCFLYGEEIFIAELNRKANLKVMYVPSIRVEDYEHISTSKIKRQTYYDYNKKAIDYILRNFY